MFNCLVNRRAFRRYNDFDNCYTYLTNYFVIKHLFASRVNYSRTYKKFSMYLFYFYFENCVLEEENIKAILGTEKPDALVSVMTVLNRQVQLFTSQNDE